MLKLIKEIREETGAGVIDVKKALEEAQGDKEKALEILRKNGVQKADKKANRIAKEGVIATYVHANNKSGAIVKVLCETDFVAMNDKFKNLANDIAMQIVAMNPVAVRPKDVSDEMIAAEIEEIKSQLATENISDDELKKKLEEKKEELKRSRALYSQSFIKNPEITIEEVIKENVATLGENIVVDDFQRFEI